MSSKIIIKDADFSENCIGSDLVITSDMVINGLIGNDGVINTTETNPKKRLTCTTMIEYDKYPGIYIPAGYKIVICWFDENDQPVNSSVQQDTWTTPVSTTIDAKSIIKGPYKEGAVKYKVSFGATNDTQLYPASVETYGFAFVPELPIQEKWAMRFGNRYAERYENVKNRISNKDVCLWLTSGTKIVLKDNVNYKWQMCPRRNETDWTYVGGASDPYNFAIPGGASAGSWTSQKSWTIPADGYYGLVILRADNTDFDFSVDSDNGWDYVTINA